ncbi:MAG: NADH-quinone oxidoreductase subunit M [Verrucomicrobiales bacterium]|nr:NADH-quinone oxidoreductase subunit M [Verrucomicrobiales bacterium]
MSILEIIVFLPILAALAIGFGAPARFTALGAAGINLICGLVAAGTAKFTDIEVGGFSFVHESSRPLLDDPELALAFGLDGISLVLLILTVIVTLAAVWVSPAEIKIKGSTKLYYTSSLLISAGALGAFLSTDLFFLYAFHELALIPTFLMIGVFGFGENRKRTAWTITIYLGVGSLILLAGLIALFLNLGGNTFDLATLYETASNDVNIPAETQSWIYLLLLVGFGILVSLFPFHSWAPDAYADAPTPIAMLHSGVLKKFGIYGLIRIATPMLPAGAEKWANLVLVLLLGNIIILGLATIAQKRLDRMLGYSSVMHMGYVFLGVVAGTTIGMSGAVLLMFAHGVSIALLFALAGSLRDRFGSLEFEKLGSGLGKTVPKLGLLFGFAAFASIGLPGFANFASEVMVFFGAFQPMEKGDSLGFLQWAAIISLWGVVISAVYMLRAYRNIFKGPLASPEPRAADLTWGERIPVLLLIVALMLIGFVPEILLKYLRPALESLTLIGGGG